jgi:hypothetical protein
MAIIGVELGADAYRFGLAVASVLLSLVLLWLANRVLAGRGQTFTPEAKAVVLGGLLIYVGQLLPWAAVNSRGGQVTLYGDSFDTQAVVVAAVVIYAAAVLSQIWKAGILRVAFLAVSVAAGVVAGMVAWQFLSSPHAEAASALRAEATGPSAQAISAPADGAQATATGPATRGSDGVSPQYGAYVVLAGGALAAGGSLFSLSYGVARGLRRPAHRGKYQGVARPSDGPLGRRGTSRGPIRLPGTVRAHGSPPLGPVRGPSPSPLPAPVPSGPPREEGAGEIPAPPPMPVAPVGRQALDPKWAADTGGAKRNRAAGRRR